MVRRVVVSFYKDEERLIAVRPTSAQSAEKKLVFVYDYQQLHVEKQVFVHDGSGWPTQPSSRALRRWWHWRRARH